MKCERCGRGCTWTRLERNPWFRLETLAGLIWLCYLCADVYDFQETDRVQILLADTSQKPYFRRLERARSGGLPAASSWPTRRRSRSSSRGRR